MIIPHPLLGPRDAQEFTYLGDAALIDRPDGLADGAGDAFYDYAYLRATWQADKEGRATAARAHRSIWESAQTLGLGTRLGPFWYPAPFPES